jgi:hypothetical protein
MWRDNVSMAKLVRVMSPGNVSTVKRAGWSNEMEFGIATKVATSPGILDVSHLQARNSCGCDQAPISHFSASRPIFLARLQEPRMDDAHGEVGNGGSAERERGR